MGNKLASLNMNDFTDVEEIIRAKRVSNCYMQEKKTDSLCVCGCSANLGFSARSANRIRPKHGIPLSV